MGYPCRPCLRSAHGRAITLREERCTRPNGRGRGLRTVQRLGDLCFHHRNLRSNGERLKFSFRSIGRACPLRYFEESFIHAQAWLFVPEVRRRKCRRLVDGSKLCICPSSFEYRLSWRRKRVPSDRRQKGLPRQASTAPASGCSAAERRHVVRQIEFKVVPGHLTKLRIYVRSLHFHTKTARTQAHLHRTHFLATSCHIAIIVARNFDELFSLSSSGLAHCGMRANAIEKRPKILPNVLKRRRHNWRSRKRTIGGHESRTVGMDF